MKVSNELIQKFLDNKCSLEETEEVIAHLSKNPALMKSVLGIQEWNEAEKDVEKIPISNQVSDKMLHRIHRSLHFNQPPKIWWKTKMASRLTAAAVLVWLAVNIWMYQHPLPGHQSLPSNKTVSNTASSVNVSSHHIAASEWVEDKNNTGFNHRILLGDGSVVWLNPQSSIRHKKLFDKDERSLYLHGQAFFEAARDKARPFVVYAGVLSTRALGTSFRICEKSGKPTLISVQLYTGKVVIQSIHRIDGWNKDIYLQPGQQLVYNELLRKTIVNKWKSSKNFRSKNTGSQREDLVFNNTPVSEVFTQLQNYYHVSIHYDKMDIQDLNFTGTVSTADSLTVFLKLLTNMKGLGLKEESNGSFKIYNTR